MKDQLKKFKYGYLLLALLLIAVGVLFIYFSDAPAKFALALGILLILYATFRFVMALTDKKRGFLFVFHLVIAFAFLVGGVLTVVFRKDAAELLLSLFALVLIIDGSFKLQTTSSLKTYTLPLFWILLSLAVIVIAGAFVALAFPLSTLEKNSVFLGIVLIFDGAANVFSPFALSLIERTEKRNMEAEILLEERRNAQ